MLYILFYIFLYFFCFNFLMLMCWCWCRLQVILFSFYYLFCVYLKTKMHTRYLFLLKIFNNFFFTSCGFFSFYTRKNEKKKVCTLIVSIFYVSYKAVKDWWMILCQKWPFKRSFIFFEKSGKNFNKIQENLCVTLRLSICCRRVVAIHSQINQVNLIKYIYLKINFYLLLLFRRLLVHIL